jgi:beta-lactamase regulating signal transducer with metallopeptidase domain
VTNPETIRLLGWCLLHFVWQGALLALMLSAALTHLRTPRARYGIAVCVLAAMIIAPFLTFAVLQQAAEVVQPISDGGLGEMRNSLETSHAMTPSWNTRQLLPLISAKASADWLSYAVLAWFAGVYMFTLRTLGAWMLLIRLRRQHAKSIAEDLLRTCHALQRRLGVTRAVRYVCSKAVESPAVLGWLRPVVVLPLSALAGLTPWQLEAIIAHELAHIKRWDAQVNVFQIAAETLLFYHPAVWWVNRVIRNEREHCCDDIAVEACGNPHGYARALALLEESRSASVWALAANGGVLSARIGRLLGIKRHTRSVSAPGFALLASLCVAGALMAGTASTEVYIDPSVPPAPTTARTERVSTGPVQAPSPPAAGSPVAPTAPLEHWARLDAGQAGAHRAHESVPAKPDNSTEGGSYIDGLQAAGLKDLTVDELIALRIQEVTPDYVRGLRAAGLQATSTELVALKIHQVTPEFVRDLTALGLTNLSVDDYVAAAIQGITPGYVQKMRSHGFKDITLQQLISLKLANIS